MHLIFGLENGTELKGIKKRDGDVERRCEKKAFSAIVPYIDSGKVNDRFSLFISAFPLLR
jgi:hypothetical protein